MHCATYIHHYIYHPLGCSCFLASYWSIDWLTYSTQTMCTDNWLDWWRHNITGDAAMHSVQLKCGRQEPIAIYIYCKSNHLDTVGHHERIDDVHGLIHWSLLLQCISMHNAHTHTHMHARMQACTHVRTYTHAHACIHMYIHMHAYTCTYTHNIHACVHAYTHTHLLHYKCISMHDGLSVAHHALYGECKRQYIWSVHNIYTTWWRSVAQGPLNHRHGTLSWKKDPHCTHHTIRWSCVHGMHLEQVTVTDSAYHHTTHVHLDRQFLFYSCTSRKVNHPNLRHVPFGSLSARHCCGHLSNQYGIRNNSTVKVLSCAPSEPDSLWFCTKWPKLGRAPN